MNGFDDIDFDEASLERASYSLRDECDIRELKDTNICYHSIDPEIRAAILALDARKKELRG